MSPIGADPLHDVTAALVESNDRLVAFLELTSLGVDVLDENAYISALLDAAVSLTGSAGGRVSGASHASAGTAWASMSPTPASCEHLLRSRGVPTATNPDRTLAVELWRSNPYRTPDTKLIDGVVNLAARAIRSAEMHRAALAQAVLLREHGAAAELAVAALPDPNHPPRCAGVDVFARSIPARQAGGDLFTWATYDGDFWFAVGDVSGKGLPAAIQMTTVVNATDNAIRRNPKAGPAQILQSIERSVVDRLSGASMFVTLAIGRWSASDQVVSIANAGHSPVLFLSRAGGVESAERVPAVIPPLGVIAGLVPDEWQAQTLPGDVLVLGSDGITEQEGPEGLFGEDTFDRVAAGAAHRFDAASGIGSSLLDMVLDHASGHEQSDDRTLMVLRFDGDGAHR